ncbi:MAG: dephospho-CoA kinase [Luteibaculum sp.]
MTPKVLGITGGIGAGKSWVSHLFFHLGFPLYNSDERAKQLLHSNEVIKQEIRQAFGSAVFIDGQIDKKALAKEVFPNPEKLEILNSIIHPKVGEDFAAWKGEQCHSAWVIKEAAILFETGTYKHCDKTLLVVAPKELRITRVMERDCVSKEEVLLRMERQWEDEKKQALADYTLSNDGIAPILPQLNIILQDLGYPDNKLD